MIAAIGRVNLVDVRSPDEFAGRLLAPAHLPQEQAQRGGHIPGAVNVPWSKAAAEDGTFKPDEALRILYADEAGLDLGKETIAYCRIGERSAHGATWSTNSSYGTGPPAFTMLTPSTPASCHLASSSAICSGVPTIRPLAAV